jgi:hypothetical protein
VNDPAQLLADLLTESIDPQVFYRLIKEHADELAPRRVADPHAHADELTFQAQELLRKDHGLSDLLRDGMMTALKDWYEEHEGI